MNSTIDKLAAAVAVWAPPDQETDTPAEVDSPRTRVNEFWTGPECGFLKVVRQCLARPDDQHQEPDEQKLHTAGRLLDRLCREFQPDVESLRDQFLPACQPESSNVFQREDWNEQLNQHAGSYRRTLSGDKYDRRLSVGRKLMPDDPDDVLEQATPRLALLAAAMAFTGRAAFRLRDWRDSNPVLPEGFADDAVAAMRCVNAVWPLFTGALPFDGMRSPAPQADGHNQASMAMERLAISGVAAAVHSSAWLTILQLLRWLLEEDNVEADSESIVQLQMVDKRTNYGHSQPLSLQPFEETACGCLIDLTQTGLLLLDHDMLESLNIAWGAGQKCLAGRAARQNRILALRLSFPTDGHLREITGDSAGGMAALGTYAVADGKRPDRRVTGSFTIARGAPQSSETLLADLVVDGVNKLTLEHKLESAAAAGCRHFLVAAAQDTEQLRSVAQRNQISVLGLHPHEFHQGQALLTTNATLAEVLQPLNEQIVQAWESVEGDDLAGTAAGLGKANWLRRPQPYVEPHLGILKPEHHALDSTELRSNGPQPAVDRTSRYEWLTQDEELRNGLTDDTQTDVAEAEYLQIFELSAHSRRICVAEDANAGKTVLSKRLAAFAAGTAAQAHLFNNQPPLVLRWENGPLGQSESWPNPKNADDLITLLTQCLPGTVRDSLSGMSGREIVEELTEQRRVVLILDSLDQANEDGRRLLQLLEDQESLSKLWVIVTGRSFSFSDQQVSSLFDRERWMMFTILPFSTNQQTRYLRADATRWNPETRQQETEPGPLQPDQDIAALFSDYAAVAELLGIAGMLAMVRQIAVLQQVEETRAAEFRDPEQLATIRLQRLKTRCDFYLEFFNRQMLSAAEKNPDLNVDDNRERWQMMLSVTAFRMVLERATNYTVQGDDRTQVMKDVKKYCQRSARMKLKRGDWAKLNEFSALSDHSILEGGSQRVLSFRHKGWMEFFAGLFLARYAEPSALRRFDFAGIRPVLTADERRQPGFQGIDTDQYGKGKKGDTALFEDVLLQLTNDAQWYWMWRFAIELPRCQPEPKLGSKSPAKPEVLARSLGLLLLPPQREIRPNELAWRAFYLFEQDERTDPELRQYGEWIPRSLRKSMLKRFRKSSRKLVKRINACTAEWDHVPAKGTKAHRKWLKHWQQQSSEVKSQTFLQCPPASWLEVDADANVNVMGEDSKGIDVKPQHQVRVTPFHLLSTPVTRSQYREFDSAFEPSGTGVMLDVNSMSVTSMLARWIAMYTDPRADESGEEADVYPVVMCNWYDAWVYSKWLGAEYCLPTECQYELGIRGGSTAEHSFVDYAAESQLDKYAWWDGNSGAHVHSVGLKRANPYGLYDGCGHVAEWSFDWYSHNWYGRRVASSFSSGICDEDSGPTSGDSRAVRSRSYLDKLDAEFFSHRGHSLPASRDYATGFRVVRLS